MPGLIIHNRMGRTVYKHLPAKIASEINREVYRLGLIGPDPYMTYRFFAFPFRNKIHKRTTIMHETRTADFLVELAKHSQPREMFSYLAGFLCHYALDSTAHPYINAISENQGNMHMAIEHRLDMQELEKLGMDLSDRPVTRGFFVPFLPETMREDYEEVMKNVYGWDDSWEKFRVAYRHFKAFFLLAEDPWGIVNVTLGHAPHAIFNGKLPVISFRSHVCDGMSFEEFEPLRREAVRRAVELIEAAYAFRSGEIDEDELRLIIGDKTYSGEKEVLVKKSCRI